MQDFLQRFRALLTKAEGAGWQVVEERTIPYGRMAKLEDGGGGAAVLNGYHGKKGFRVVVAGRDADALRSVLGLGGAAAGTSGATGRVAGPDPFGLGSPRTGADESGKGDYFGPLVTAAWRFEDDQLDALQALGVTDSKALGRTRVRAIAGALDDMEAGHVEVLMPRDYNAAWAKARNVNTVLAALHGRCLHGLASRLGWSPVVIVDRFMNNDAAFLRALELPKAVRLATHPKGEADVAVAAASILARARFLDCLEELGSEFGQTLHAGAGDPTLKAGRLFVQSFGAEALQDVAKVHFATTKHIT
jgi:ribonuclease HIII